MSNMLSTLGASLSQATGKDEILCRGVLRMTIINSVEHLRQMTDPIQTTIETVAHITKMTYDDWKAIIEGSALPRNLANIGVKEPNVVVTRLKQALIDQQSLLTMTVHSG